MILVGIYVCVRCHRYGSMEGVELTQTVQLFHTSMAKSVSVCMVMCGEIIDVNNLIRIMNVQQTHHIME